MLEREIKIIKPPMINKTNRTLPNGEQITVMRRDRTLTEIAWRIPIC